MAIATARLLLMGGHCGGRSVVEVSGIGKQ